jgi:hypothetical protein
MSHRFTFPQVRELLPARPGPQPGSRPATQRERVAASLLLRPGNSLKA